VSPNIPLYAVAKITKSECDTRGGHRFTIFSIIFKHVQFYIECRQQNMKNYDDKELDDILARKKNEMIAKAHPLQ